MSAREAVRAVFVDGEGAVFLMRVVEPQSKQGWWITPGGGIEDGETSAATLRRETAEELGIDLAQIGAPRAIWHRNVAFKWGGQEFTQHETFYLVDCERFDPPVCQDGNAKDSFTASEPRWWTMDELRSSSENIAPDGLAGLLEGLDRADLSQPPADITA